LKKTIQINENSSTNRDNFINFMRIFYKNMIAWIKQNWRLFSCISLMLILLIYNFFFKIQLISGNMPYSCHTDEKYIIEPALRILKSGDFNPHSFRYPSFPIYLATLSFTVGYLNSVAHLELKNTQDIEPSVYPYFKHPRIIWHAKIVFLLLSTLAILFMALLAYRFCKNPFFLFGVPLITFLSRYYFYVSYNYLNVDTVATFFIFLVYLHQTLTVKEDSIIHKVIVPGFLSGLIVGCKYNLIWIIVPSILNIMFHFKKKRGRKVLSLFLIMFLTFVLVVPFSVLDFNTFLDWLAYDIHVYKTGDTEHSSAPGFSQLSYYLNYFQIDFGYILCFLALIGIIACFILDWKKGLLLLSFPALLLLQMSSYVIHYPRNIMSLFGFFAIFSVLGITLLYKFLFNIFKTFSPKRWPDWGKRGLAFFLIGVVLFFPVKEKIKKQSVIKPDSRNQALIWIKQEIKKTRNIIIASELGLYIKPFTKDYNIFIREFKVLDSQSFYKQANEIKNPIIIMPVFRPHYEHQLVSKKKSETLNEIGASLKIIKTFGSKKMIINRPKHITYANPKILVGTL